MTDRWIHGQNISAMHRTSNVRYTSRPPANRRTAREAWDRFAATGPVVWVRLLDGYWGCERPNGDIEEIENTFAANRRLRERKNV